MPSVLTRLLHRLLLLALCAALALALAQSWRLALWRDRAQTAEARVSAYAEAARVRSQHERRHAALAAAAQALDHELNRMEGGDAPLSDFLRAAAGRLWN